MGSRGECRGFGSSCSTVVRFGWVCAQILLDYFNTVCAVRNKTTPQLCNRSECNRIITGHVVSGLDPPAKLSALGTMPACCRHLRVSACAAQGGEPPLAGIPHQPRARPRPAIGEKSDRVAGILSHVDSDFSEFIRRRCRHCPRKLDNQRFREKAIVVDLDFVPLTPCDCYSRVHVIDFAGTERHS